MNNANTDNTPLATYLQRLMDRRDMNPNRLAELSGVHKMTISHILNGTTQRPNLETLVAFADVFSVDLDVLLEKVGITVKRSTPDETQDRLKAMIDNDPALASVLAEAQTLDAAQLRGVLAYIEAIKNQR
jgi:transcriptional regulator with XRE-family HTH domain